MNPRWLAICALMLLLGCGSKDPAPPAFNTQHREAIKRNLTAMGAKVTSEIPEALYLSLRNTHIEVHELGGVIDGSNKLPRDLQDFGKVSEAVAQAFLQPEEFDEFKKWLRQAMSPQAAAQRRTEYHEFKVSFTRDPLRMLFTRRAAAEG